LRLLCRLRMDGMGDIRRSCSSMISCCCWSDTDPAVAVAKPSVVVVTIKGFEPAGRFGSICFFKGLCLLGEYYHNLSNTAFCLVKIQYSDVYHVFVYSRGFWTVVYWTLVWELGYQHNLVQRGFGAHTSSYKITAADFFRGFCFSSSSNPFVS
jgi:hypothetical protein